jgi:hypothetical protein
MELVADMKAKERSSFVYFMERAQSLILNLPESSTAFLGNKLREQAERDQRRLADQLEGSSSEFKSYLSLLISSSDRAIIQKKIRLGTVADDT